MTELAKPSNEPTPAELKYGGGWKILIPFAILPLVVVSISVGVFFLFGMLAKNELGPQDYLMRLKSTSTHRRWQSAYELSRFLAKGNIDQKSDFENEMLSILKTAGKEEVDFRKYLVIGLAQIGSEKSAPDLMELGEKDENSEIRIFSIWALGRIGAKSSAAFVEKQSHSEDAGIRKTAAFTLGFVGNHSHEKRLVELLDDPVEDVRWNSALGLAQLNSAQGKGVLLQLIDLEYVKLHTPNLRDSERTQIMLSAVNGFARLKLKDSKEPLLKLAESAPDAALRTAARNVLSTL